MGVVVMLEVTTRGDQDQPGPVALVNPEFIAAVLPGRPPWGSISRTPYGARILLGTPANKVGSAQAPMQIDTTDSVDDISGRLRQAAEALGRPDV